MSEDKLVMLQPAADHNVASHSNSLIGDDNNNDHKQTKEFNSLQLKQKLKIIFTNKEYIRLLPMLILWVIAGYMPTVFFNAWATEQFSGCSAHSASEEDANCEFDYNGYNKTASIFSSCGGVMSFLFGALIGRISDSYGRKPIFYLNIILSALLYAPLIFWPNIWIYFFMLILAGLNSVDNSLTPMMMAYMSDVIPEHQRTFAYSIAYAFCAVGLVVGVGSSITLGIFYGDEANFVAIAIVDIVQIMYVYFMLPESLKPRNRKAFLTKNLNPFRPLYHCCCYHPIVLWISVIQFFISLPETGILDLALLWNLDQLSIENETDANIANAVFILFCSFGLLIGTLFLLPKLQSRNYTNIQILCVGISLFFVSFVCFSLLAWVKTMIISVIGAMLITLGFISFPSANGIVTKYLTKSEHGIGFGVIFAVRSLTWIIAPITFAQMYSIFKKWRVPAMTMYIAAFMILFAFVIIIFPLKRSIEKTERLGKVCSFSTVELQFLDNMPQDNDENLTNTQQIKLTEEQTSATTVDEVGCLKENSKHC